MYDTLAAILDDPTAWQFNTQLPGNGSGTATLPLDVVVPYPLTTTQTGPTILRPASKQDFWGADTPDGPGSVPLDVGSIKAARIAQLGLCSTELPTAFVVDSAVAGVGVGFIQGACDYNGSSKDVNLPIFGNINFGDYTPTLQPTRYYMNGASFLRHAIGDIAAQGGGFFLNGKFDMNSNFIGLGDCTMVFLSCNLMFVTMSA